MAAIELAGGNATLNVTPWMDSGYVFNDLIMQEEIGDNIAYGKVNLTSDGNSLDLMLSQDTLNINLTALIWQNVQPIWNITGWIYRREMLENDIILHFVAIPNDDFTITSKVQKYKLPIKDVIKDLYPGTVKFLDSNDSELEPDVKGNLEDLDQNGMTSFDFCSRLCRSYRKDAIYYFGLEGLFIKNIYRNPPCYTVYEEADAIPLSSHSVNYYKEMNLDSVQRDKSVNISAKMYGWKYDTVRTDFHSDLMQIYQYNERYTTNLKSDLLFRFSTRLPEFKTGDQIIYENKLKFNKGKKYIVTKQIFSIDLNDIRAEVYASSWEDPSM